MHRLRSGIRSTPDFCGWNGQLLVLDNIAYHLQEDSASLRQMSLASQIFSLAAQRALFRELLVMNSGAAYRLRIRLEDFAFYHGFDAVPWSLKNVKQITISLDCTKDDIFVPLLHRIKGVLPSLECLQLFGFDELTFLSPTNNWLTMFVRETEVTVLSLNGTFVPECILDFDIPSLRTINFKECRICYNIDGLEATGWRQPTLDARLHLKNKGDKWERVEELVSGAINAETLSLVKDCAAGLDTLGLRVAFDKFNTTPDMELLMNISGLRCLNLQVPAWSIQHIPDLLRDLIPKATYLTMLELCYEPSWSLDNDWEQIVQDASRAICSAACALDPPPRLRSVLFRFHDTTRKPVILSEKIHDVNVGKSNIYIGAQYDSKPLNFSPPESPLASFGNILLDLLECANAIADVDF